MTTCMKGMCPHCNQGLKRRKRIDGVLSCPECEQPVYVIGDFNATEKRPALSVELWKLFKKLARPNNGHDLDELTDKEYIRELSIAIALLKRCDGSIELAREVINQCFTIKALKWKNRTSMVSILYDFRLAVVAARAALQQRSDEEAVVSKYVNRFGATVPSF